MLALDELELLSRHQAGELSAEEAGRAEALLARSAEAREALAKLAAIELDALVLGARRREEAAQLAQAAGASAHGDLEAEDAIAAAIARAQAPAASKASSAARARAPQTVEPRAAPVRAAPQGAEKVDPRRRARSRWLKLGAAGSAFAAAALFAWIAVARGPMKRPADGPELRVLAGSARLNGAALAPGAHAPLASPLTLETGDDGVALLELNGARLLLAPRSQLAAPEPSRDSRPERPDLALRRGAALAEGPIFLRAGGSTLALDGLALVSREPFEAAEQATRALHNLNAGDPMKTKMMQAMAQSKWSGFGAAAGAAAAVFLASGDARATSSDGRTAALHAGESWSAAQPPRAAPSAALTANANPVKSPASAARAAPAAAKAAQPADGDPDHAAILATAKGALLACFKPAASWAEGAKVQAELEATLARDGASERVAEMRVISYRVTLDHAAFSPGHYPDDAQAATLSECLADAVTSHVRFAPHEARQLQIPLTITPADGGVSFECMGSDAPPPPTAAPQAVSEAGAPTEGPSSAPVTIAEFTDYQCSFCKHVNDTLLALQQLYGDKIRFVFKQDPLPFHENARRAAAAVLAANAQGQFAAYRKLVYYGGGDALTEATLEGYAQQVGLDLSRFKSDLASGRFDPQIDADLAEAKQLDIQGTPTFVINGQVLRGAQPVEEFTKLIDAALAAHN